MSRISTSQIKMISVMKKRRQSYIKKGHMPFMNNIRTIIMNDIELFDNIFKQIDDLKDWCEDIESRIWYIEETLRLLQNGSRSKVTSWYKSSMNKKANA